MAPGSLAPQTKWCNAGELIVCVYFGLSGSVDRVPYYLSGGEQELVKRQRFNDESPDNHSWRTLCWFASLDVGR